MWKNRFPKLEWESKSSESWAILPLQRLSLNQKSTHHYFNFLVLIEQVGEKSKNLET